MTRRVLITGGYGYIGGRVAQYLAARGWAVTLGTRRAPGGAPDWLPQAQPQKLEWHAPAQLEAACAGHQTVVHLAAMNEIDALRDPVGALQVNGVESLRLLEAAVAAGVGRFVHLSTAHVYGRALAGTVDEHTLPRPVHPYAITHKTAEDFVLAAHDAGRIEGVVLRLSNGFGAPAHAGVDRWSLLVNDLCRQAAAGGALVLKSTGLQQRDFITLEDTARAIAHVLELPRPALADGLFNAGGDTPMRVIDMTELIAARCAAVLGHRPVIERPPARPDEVEGASLPSLDYRSGKLQAIGFVPTRNLAREIDNTLLLCRQTFGTHAGAQSI